MPLAIGPYGNFNLTLGTNNAARMTILGNGNVGIGTTSPMSKFAVVNSSNELIFNDPSVAATGNYLTVKAISGVNGQSGLNLKIDSTNLWQVLTDNNAAGAAGNGFFVQYGGNTANRFFSVNTNGNVGIGTTTPRAQLHLESSNGQTTANFTDAGSTNDSFLLNDISQNAGSGGTILFGSSPIGRPFSAIKSLLTNGVGNTVGDLAFSTRNATSDTALTERMRILSGGNVGIGATAPDEKLVVTGAIRTTSNATNWNTQTSGVIDYFSNNMRIVAGAPAATNNGISFYTTNSGTNVQAMQILPGGNVGIGATNPGELLEVKASAADSSLRLNNTAVGTKAWNITAGGGGNYSAGTFAIRNVTDATTPFFILANGKVGISNTAPATLLHVGSTSPTLISANNYYNSEQVSGDLQVMGTTYLNNLLVTGSTTFANENVTNATTTNATSTNLAVTGKFYTPLTQGSVPFIGGNGLLTQNNANFFWDATNARLGIGTPTPNELLEVNGNIRIPTTGSSLKFGTQRNLYRDGNAFYMGEIDASALPVQIRSGGNDVVRITTGGNVGIGTTSPTALLHAYSTGNSAITVDRLNSSGAAQYNLAQGSVTRWALVDRDSGALVGSQTRRFDIFDTINSAARLSIDNSGNVGIGITNPGAKLDVNGNLRVSTGNSLSLMNTANDYEATIRNDAGTGSSVLRFFTGATERITILHAGNVGIGTIAPVAKLETSLGGSPAYTGTVPMLYASNIWPQFPRTIQNVAATISTNNNVVGTGPVIGLNLENNSNTDGTYSPLITFSRKSASGVYNPIYASIGGIATGNGGDANWLGGDLVFGTAPLATGQGPLERMRILGNGNVGIGTAGPLSKLDVNGGLAVGGYAGTNAAPANGMIVSGNVAIGSATVLNGKMSVLSSTADILSIQSTTPGGYLVFADNATPTWANAPRIGAITNDMVITTSATERVRITTSGNVGIGTSTPTGNQLLINSTQGTTGNAALKIVYGGGTSVLGEVSALAHRNGVWDGLYINGIGSSLTNSIFVEGTQPVIFNAGNVGIGNTAPASKLDVVSGTANTTADSVGTLGNFTGPTQAGQNSMVSIDSNDAMAIDTGGVLGFGGRYVTGGTGYANWASIKGLKADATSGNYGGYLSFWTRTTGAGSVERMRIDTNGNVGIGTTNPYAIDDGPVATKFHVKVTGGTGNVEVGRFEGGSDADNTYGVLRVNHNNDRGFFVKGGRQIGNTAIATMGLTDNVGAMTDIMTFLGSNVGIGTTNPIKKLEIQSSVANNALRIGDGVSNAAFTYDIWRDSAVGPLNFYGNQTGATGYVFSGVDGERMRIATNGNVGIGTTNPGTKLSVSGGAAVGSGYATTAVTDGNLIVATSIGIGTTNATARGLNVVAPSDVGIEVTVPRTTGTNYGIISSATGAGATLNQGLYASASGATSNYSIRIPSPVASAGNYAIYSDATAQSYFAGNVGIGTTTPAQLLTVGNLTGNSAGSSFYNIGAPTIGVGSSLYSYGYICAGNNSGACTSTNGVVIGPLNTSAGISLNSGTGNSFFNNGNIGIGTTTPNARLVVSGPVNTSGAPASWVQNLIIDNALTSTQNVTEYRVAGTARGSLRVDSSGDMVLSGAGTGATYISYDGGTGGVIFGTGAQTSNANVSAAGVYTGTGLTVGSGTITSGLINGQTISSAANFTGTLNVNGIISGNSKQMFNTGDTWLRINETNAFVSGIYAGTGILRTDGNFQVGANGTSFNITAAGVATGGTYNGQTISSAANFTGTINAASTITAPTFSGNLSGQFNNGSIYSSPTNGNTFNSGYGTAADNADIWINYRGYNDGQLYFRDFRVGNGKGTQIALFKGSDSSVTLAGALSAGAITGTSLTVGAGTITSGLINGQTISSAANFTGTVAVATGVTSPYLSYPSSPLGGLYGSYPNTNANNRSFVYSINASYANVGTHYGISYDQSNNTICIEGSSNCNVRLGMDGTSSYFNLGNVGIGTTSPSQALSVNGGMLFTASSTGMNGINLTAGCYAINGVCIGAGGAVNLIGAALTKGNFLVGNDAGLSQATSTIFISSTGNVGIGATAPNGKLEIVGSNANTDGAVFGPVTTDNNFAIQTYIDAGVGGGGWAGRTTYAGGCCNNLALQPDVGTVTIGETTGNLGYKFEVAGTASVTSNLTVGGTITSGLINGQTISSAANFTGTLNANGLIYGNSKEIFNTGDSYLRLNQSVAFSSGIWMGGSNFMGGAGILAMGSNGGTTNSRVYINGGTYNATNVINLDGATGNIYAAGNVNVGGTIFGNLPFNYLTTPTASPQINMSTYSTGLNWTTGTAANDLFKLTTDNGANGTGYALLINTGASATVKPLHVVAGSIEALAVDTAGRVGIGTTGPGEKLHIVSTQGQDGIYIDTPTFPEILFKRSTVNKAFVAIAGSSGGYGTGTLADSLIFRSESGFTHFLNAGTVVGTFNGSNFGIGTTSPSMALSVVGTTTGQDIVPNSNLLYSLGTSKERFATVWAGTTNIGTSTWAISTGADGRLTFNNAANSAGTETVSFATNGNVGIGNTNPQFSLDVAGNQRFYGTSSSTSLFQVSVMSSGWSSGNSSTCNGKILMKDASTLVCITSSGIQLGKYNSTDISWYPVYTGVHWDTVFYGAGYPYMSAAMLDSSRVAIAYNYTSWGVKVVVCTLGETYVASCGSPTASLVTSSQPMHVDLEAVNSGGDFIVTYSDNVFGTGVFTRVGQTSGNTISSISSAVTLTEGGTTTSYPQLQMFSATTTKFMLRYVVTGGLDRVVVGNISGTTVTYGQKEYLTTGAAASAIQYGISPLSESNMLIFPTRTSGPLAGVSAVLLSYTSTSTISTSTVLSLSTFSTSAASASSFVDPSHIAVGYANTKYRIITVSSSTALSMDNEQTSTINTNYWVLGLTPTSFIASGGSTMQILRTRDMTTNYSIDQFNAPNTSYILSAGAVNSAAAAALDSTRHVVVANQGSTITLRIGFIGGGTISYGPAVTIATTTTNVAVAALDANTFVLVKSGSQGFASAYSCTVSATVNITCGNPSVFYDSGWNGGPPIISVAPLGSTNFVVGYASSTSGNRQSVKTRVGAISGSTITSFGSEQSVGADALNVTNIAITAIAGTTNKFVLAYNDLTTGVSDSQNKGKVLIGNTSGTTITLGNPEIVLAASTSANMRIVSPALNQFVVFASPNSGTDMFATFGNITGQTTLSTTTTAIGPVASYTTFNASVMDSNHILVQALKQLRVIEVDSSGISKINSIQTLYTSNLSTYNGTWGAWAQNATTSVAVITTSDPTTQGILTTFDTNAFYYQPKTLVIKASGNDIEQAASVGIGTQNPLYALHVQVTTNGAVAGFTNSNGYCTINPTATALSCASDARLKKNINTLASSTEIVRKLRGVNFNWKSDETGANHIGFIAQEVQQVVPELVEQDANGILAVNYLNFAPILVNAWNNMDVRVSSLESIATTTLPATSTPMLAVTDKGLGIGTLTPNFALHAKFGGAGIAVFENDNGVCEVNPSTGSFGCAPKLNQGVTIGTTTIGTTLASSTDIIRKLRGVNISMMGASTTANQLGFLADDVQLVAPELVDNVNGIKLVRTTDIIPLLVNSIGDLAEKVDSLDTRLSKLEATVASSTALSATSTASTTGVYTSGTSDVNFIVNSVLTAFQNMGTTISLGMAHFTSVFADNIVVGSQEKPAGITLYDIATHQPYCLRIENGGQVTAPGTCADTISTGIAQTTSTSGVTITSNTSSTTSSTVATGTTTSTSTTNTTTSTSTTNTLTSGTSTTSTTTTATTDTASTTATAPVNNTVSTSASTTPTV